MLSVVDIRADAGVGGYSLFGVFSIHCTSSPDYSGIIPLQFYFSIVESESQDLRSLSEKFHKSRVRYAVSLISDLGLSCKPISSSS